MHSRGKEGDVASPSTFQYFVLLFLGARFLATQQARISLSGTDPKKVDSVCQQIKTISERTGVAMSGPIPLPTKRLVVPCRKSPDGEGTETWERHEMRIHKRLIDLVADERALHLVMRVQIPSDVNIEIQVID